MERSTLHGTGQTAPASTVDKPETETCKKNNACIQGCNYSYHYNIQDAGRWVRQTPSQMGAADPFSDGCRRPGLPTR